MNHPHVGLALERLSIKSKQARRKLTGKNRREQMLYRIRRLSVKGTRLDECVTAGYLCHPNNSFALLDVIIRGGPARR